MRILHLEDNHLDAELVRETLAVGGLAAQIDCVDTKAAYVAALENVDFDLILADYTLPLFDGNSALAIAAEKKPEIPFIFVSGSLGEEVAIESLKSGATDYVLKQHLQRLSHAVHRAIQERNERIALRESNSRLESALAQIHAKQSELTAKTEQLWQASKLATMGELAASIAHELNNPLATIGLRTEALVGQLWQDPEKRRALEVVLREVDRMATLVNNLLQFSRRSYRQVSTVDLRDEVTTSCDFLSYHLRRLRIEVACDLAEQVPTTQADRQQLRQLFLNLLTNACDAMPGGGKLTVRVHSHELNSAEAVKVEFEDTGEGIAAHDLDAIWDPFFTTKPEGKGTGLGLAICRRIVEEHGGVINIESREGNGTTVRMAFPATANGMSESEAEKVIFID